MNQSLISLSFCARQCWERWDAGQLPWTSWGWSSRERSDIPFSLWAGEFYQVTSRPDRTELLTWFLCHNSDIDIESERLRALGENRFQLWSLNRLANLRLYRLVEKIENTIKGWNIIRIQSEYKIFWYMAADREVSAGGCEKNSLKFSIWVHDFLLFSTYKIVPNSLKCPKIQCNLLVVCPIFELEITYLCSVGWSSNKV